MKIGIISDIHSNIQALNAILKEFEKIRVEKIICCGDMIGIGINPEETVQALMKVKEKLIIVLGNHEKYLINGLPKTVHNDNRCMSYDEIENHKWNQNKLSKKSKLFINRLKDCEKFQILDKKIYVTHYPKKEDGTYKNHIKNPSAMESKELFKEIKADIFLYGHVHMSSVYNVENKWYINPGSLGCPKGKNIAQAGILEINNGKIKYKSIDVKYNVNEIIEEIKQLKFPFYKKILEIFYGYKE